MDWLLILPALGLVVGAIALAMSSFSLVRKVSAERRYLQHLRARHLEFVNKWSSRFDTTVIDMESLDRAIKRLADEAKHLPDEDRKYILEGLYQESMRGRARYTEKLFDKLRNAA